MAKVRFRQFNRYGIDYFNGGSKRSGEYFIRGIAIRSGLYDTCWVPEFGFVYKRAGESKVSYWVCFIKIHRMERVIKFRAWDGYTKYEVGDDGSVWSLDYNHTGQRRQLKKCTIGSSKDPVVYFVVGNNKKIMHVNKMVATLFVPNPEGKPCVINKNGNKADSDYLNLEWATMSEVALHGYKLGRKTSDLTISEAKKRFGGESNPKAKITEATVLSIRRLRSIGKSLKEISERHGISKSQVSAIANLKSWK